MRLEILNLRLKLMPIYQFISFAQSCKNPYTELGAEWRKILAKHADEAEKLLNEAFE